jgi:hypothetical protein
VEYANQMTDPEFLQTIDQFVAYAKQRRQEVLQAADVDKFKDWDSAVSTLEHIVAGRRLRLLLDKQNPPAESK